MAGLAVALGGWLRGPVAMPIRVLAGAGSIVLLYLEPLWIGIGLALLAVARRGAARTLAGWLAPRWHARRSVTRSTPR